MAVAAAVAAGAAAAAGPSLAAVAAAAAVVGARRSRLASSAGNLPRACTTGSIPAPRARCAETNETRLYEDIRNTMWTEKFAKASY